MEKQMCGSKKPFVKQAARFLTFKINNCQG